MHARTQIHLTCNARDSVRSLLLPVPTPISSRSTSTAYPSKAAAHSAPTAQGRVTATGPHDPSACFACACPFCSHAAVHGPHATSAGQGSPPSPAAAWHVTRQGFFSTSGSAGQGFPFPLAGALTAMLNGCSPAATPSSPAGHSASQGPASSPKASSQSLSSSLVVAAAPATAAAPAAGGAAAPAAGAT